MGTYDIKWRPRKRQIQSELTDRIASIEGFKHKKIITLCGPDLDGAVGVYELHELHKKGIILVDRDEKQIQKSVLCTSKRNLGDFIYKLKDGKKAQLIHGDIFDVAERYKNKISGFDFDFCSTLNHIKIDKIFITVKNSKSKDVWIRVTTCHRSISKYEQKRMLEFMRNQFKEDFHELDWAVRGYKDSHSPAMNVWQVVLRRKKMEEQKMKKTMKNLTAKEKDMLRALVQHKAMYNWPIGYDDKDICDMFGIAKGTLTALKAHITMSRK